MDYVFLTGNTWPLAILSMGGLGALAFCTLWQKVVRPRHGHIFHWKRGCNHCEDDRRWGIDTPEAYDP